MMRSLLAERFHLAVHFETPTVFTFELRLVKPGKLGPKAIQREPAQLCTDEVGGNKAIPAPPCEIS
jgi:uncharacterized protein (TIGR03435 family)